MEYSKEEVIRVGEFHYENITEDNKTGYSKSTNPVIYYLLASL